MPRTKTVLDVIVTVGALAAAYGIIQYGMLHFDSLRLRPRGTMGHYMTYSGTLMLVIGVAAARIVFGVRDRLWPALVMPALIVALTLTFTRSAWVGVCVGVSLLFILKDFRLTGLLPVIVALLFALAPDGITDRIMSVFDLRDPSSRDRVAMVQTGVAMIKDHPLTGVGPNMVERLYPQYRDPTGVREGEPAPAQRAAADRRGTRLAGTRGLAGLHRRAGRRTSSGSSAAAQDRVLAAACAGGDRGDALRRHVRVQLRRLGIPDALPRDRHAAVCGGRPDLMLLPPVTPERARRIASATGSARILVIGDAMLDKFIVGRVTRISPEAPVPVVAFDHEMLRMGGAANVAHNVTALGGQATLVAVTGMDDAAATLAHACREAGIAPSLVGDASRPTTTKVRIVTDRNQQVARIDYEADAEIADDIERRILGEIETHAPRATAIVVSDYLKGCITRTVVHSGRRQRRARECRCSSIRRSRTSSTTPARRS